MVGLGVAGFVQKFESQNFQHRARGCGRVFRVGGAGAESQPAREARVGGARLRGFEGWSRKYAFDTVDRFAVTRDNVHGGS